MLKRLSHLVSFLGYFLLGMSLMGFESIASSMETMTARTLGDGGAWGSGPATVDAASKAEEGFAYKDKITEDERARWTSARSMNQESDTEIEGAIAREKPKNDVYQHLKETNDSGSSKARPRYRDVHKESSWSSPEMIGVMENPEEVFSKAFTDCTRAPVYKTSFEKTHHPCKEGRPLTHHRCTKYLKAKDYQKKKEYLNTTITVIGINDDNGNVSYPRWVKTGHGVHFDSTWWMLITRSVARPPEFIRFPGDEDPPDFLPSGTYYAQRFMGHQTRYIIQHNNKYYKREADCDAFGRVETKPWIEITQEEFVEPEGGVLEDTWVSDCEELEQKTKEGLCAVDSGYPRCTSDRETHHFDGKGLRRECWQKEYRYACSGEMINTCSPLREQGCHQISSKCTERRGPECVSYDIEMECLKTVKEPTGETHLVCGGAPFCMDGACHREDYDPNKDLMEVMTKLKVLSKTAEHMTGDKDSLRIFTGGRLQCKKDMMSFRDCCGTGGWGVGMNLAGCGGEEQTLAKKRSKGLCVEVGTYCAHKDKITKICLTKKTSFCCFPSKLLRLIQEQGRAQLSIGWGDPEHTDCRGLTADELSRVDFSRLNLQEIEADLVGDLDVEKVDESLRERLGQIQEGLGGSAASSFTPSLMGEGAVYPIVDREEEGDASVETHSVETLRVETPRVPTSGVSAPVAEPLSASPSKKRSYTGKLTVKEPIQRDLSLQVSDYAGSLPLLARDEPAMFEMLKWDPGTALSVFSVGELEENGISVPFKYFIDHVDEGKTLPSERIPRIKRYVEGGKLHFMPREAPALFQMVKEAPVAALKEGFSVEDLISNGIKVPDLLMDRYRESHMKEEADA